MVLMVRSPPLWGGKLGAIPAATRASGLGAGLGALPGVGVG